MHASVAFVLCALVSLTFYLVFSRLVTAYRNAVLAKSLGCKRAPKLGDAFGIDNVRRAIKADKEKRFPAMLIERTNEISEREGRLVPTFEMRILGEKMFFTSEPKNIQALLATQFKDFGLGKSRISNFGPLLGHGIFASDGKQWEHSRAMLRPQFARDQISDLDLEERHVQNMMRALPVNADGWTSVTDLQVLFFRLTLDSATEFLFGESVDSQLTELSNPTSQVTSSRDEKQFAYAFDRSQYYLAKGARFGDRHWLAHNKEFFAMCKQVHDFVDHFVQLALSHQTSQSDVEKGKERYIFLEALAQSTRDPIELRDQLLNILLAGRDTTASLLGWAFLLLDQHPRAFAKLRAAVLSEFGTYDAPRNLTFSALKNCTYLQWVLNETLRLYPVVPANSRRAAKPTTIPLGGGPDGRSPVFIPKGCEVNYSVHVMHRRRDLWGEDADAFRPERWEGRRPGWEYLPFNGGPRICLGQQFALTEAGYVVVRLMQRFDSLQSVEGTSRIDQGEHGLTLTSCPAQGVKMRLRKSSD